MRDHNQLHDPPQILNLSSKEIIKLENFAPRTYGVTPTTNIREYKQTQDSNCERCLNRETNPSCFGQQIKSDLFVLIESICYLPPVYNARWKFHSVPFINKRRVGNCKYQFPKSLIWFNQESNQSRSFQWQTSCALGQTSDQF